MHSDPEVAAEPIAECTDLQDANMSIRKIYCKIWSLRQHCWPR